MYCNAVISTLLPCEKRETVTCVLRSTRIRCGLRKGQFVRLVSFCYIITGHCHLFSILLHISLSMHFVRGDCRLISSSPSQYLSIPLPLLHCPRELFIRQSIKCQNITNRHQHQPYRPILRPSQRRSTETSHVCRHGGDKLGPLMVNV